MNLDRTKTESNFCNNIRLAVVEAILINFILVGNEFVLETSDKNSFWALRIYDQHYPEQRHLHLTGFETPKEIFERTKHLEYMRNTNVKYPLTNNNNKFETTLNRYS